MLADFKKRTAKELEPRLEIVDEEGQDYPKGTRLIGVFASAAHFLLIVKMGNEYNIVSAQFGSPD